MARKSVSRPRVVKPFSDIASGRQDHSRFVLRHRRQGSRYFPPLLLSHTSLQDEDVLGTACQLGCEILEMLRPTGQKQRAPSRFYGSHDVVGDHLVARGIIYQSGIDVLYRDLSEVGSHPEFGVAGSDLVLEGRRFRHCPGAHAEAHGPTLHVNDRMVPVLSRRRGGQTDDILGLHLPHHLFEREGGYVVTFIDDHLTVLTHEVLHFVFSVQALDDGDVYAARPIHLATADMPDRFGRQIQEHPKALLPLIEQLLPVNHDQSVDLALRDQPRCNGGLPERRRSAEDAFVVGR